MVRTVRFVRKIYALYIHCFCPAASVSASLPYSVKQSLAGLLILLAGRSVGPRYHPPEAPPPAAWVTGPAADAWPSSDWWSGFNSAELNGLIDRARHAMQT